MVNHLLETSHLSSSALRLGVSVADPSSILRTHFQVPYPLSPLFATLTQTAGCVPKIPILETSSLPAPPRGTLVGLQTVNLFRKGGDGDRSQGCTGPRGRTLREDQARPVSQSGVTSE